MAYRDPVPVPVPAVHLRPLIVAVGVPPLLAFLAAYAVTEGWGPVRLLFSGAVAVVTHLVAVSSISAAAPHLIPRRGIVIAALTSGPALAVFLVVAFSASALGWWADVVAAACALAALLAGSFLADWLLRPSGRTNHP